MLPSVQIPISLKFTAVADTRCSAKTEAPTGSHPEPNSDFDAYAQAYSYLNAHLYSDSYAYGNEHS